MAIENLSQSEGVKNHSFLADLQNLRTGILALFLSLSPVIGCKSENISQSNSCPPCQPCKECPSETTNTTAGKDESIVSPQIIDTAKSDDNSKKHKKAPQYLNTRYRVNTLAKPEEK